jgi:hypothetical protein
MKYQTPPTPWHCQCGWIGQNPSISDASETKVDAEGRLYVDRVHYACCPLCFHAVRRQQETSHVR